MVVTSRRSRKKLDFIVDYKMARLMLKSEAMKNPDFSLMLDHLKKYEELTRTALNEMNFDIYVISALIEECQAEWKFAEYKNLGEDFKEKNIQCQLCDQERLKHIHTVMNKVNKEKFIIGSNCAAQFGDDMRKIAKNEEQVYNRMKAMQTITKEYPYLLEYIENNKSTSNKTVVLPSKLYTDKNEGIFQLKKMVDKYYSSPTSKIFTEIQRIWGSLQETEKQIDKHLNDYKRHLFFPTKEITHWLQRTNQSRIVANIRKNNGLIPKTDFYKILELSFIKQLLNKVKASLMVNTIYFVANNNISKKITFRTSYLKDSKLILEVDTPVFLQIYAELLFDEPYELEIYKHELLKESEISVKFNSMGKLFSNYRSNFEKIGYEVITNKYGKDDLILKVNDTYIKYNVDKFARNIKKSYFSNEIPSEVEIRVILDKSFERSFDERQWQVYLDVSKNSKESFKNKFEG
ncbi:hypothetical protein [Lysinibacillus sp. TE18511]